MELKDIEQLYLHRQSCRAFDPDRPVSDELLTEICRLALLAPSACNSQPWKLLAVTGEKAKELAAGVQDLGMNKFASDAPAFVVVLEGTGNLSATVGSRFKNTDFLHNDIGIRRISCSPPTRRGFRPASSAGAAKRNCAKFWDCPKKCASPISLRSAMRRKDMRSAKRSVSPSKTPFLLSADGKNGLKKRTLL